MIRVFGKWATPLLATLLMGCSDSTGPTGRGPSDATARRLIAGEKNTCALSSERDVYCWGLSSSFWEYGAPPETKPGGFAPVPAAVPSLERLALGVGTHFCGIAVDQSARCWARGTFGQLGGGAPGDTGNAVVTVTGGIEWADISVGRLTTCGLSESGAGYCWGHNQRGEVGDSSIALAAHTLVPNEVEGGRTFKSIVAGWLHACGITTAGEAFCWGGNHSGQMGIGAIDEDQRRSPMPVNGGHTFAQITLGSRYTCGLTTDGEAYCWGENGAGQLGDGTRDNRSVPTQVAGGLRFVRIVASSGFGDGSFAPRPTTLQGAVGHTCALTAAGVAYCWGWNGNGELGDGTNVDRLTPQRVAGNQVYETIALGGAHTCGMQGDRVWCWGSNTNGQLGTGSMTSSATPQAVRAPFGPR
jgi:alpha-tubulin suppressor-like RCC1 family protein